MEDMVEGVGKKGPTYKFKKKTKVTFAPWLHPVKIWLHTVSG